jgi:hypothetical protein
MGFQLKNDISFEANYTIYLDLTLVCAISNKWKILWRTVIFRNRYFIAFENLA